MMDELVVPASGPVIGVGVDICAIDRIGAMRERHGTRFLKRVFTEDEISYCLRMKSPDRSLAARFAAKEAVSKAFGVGIGEFLNWVSISIRSGDRGEPIVVSDAKARKLIAKFGVARIAISLSHTDETAIAFAVLVGRM